MKIALLNDVATRRGQTLGAMALAWLLRQPAVTSTLVGASRPEQIRELVQAQKNTASAPEELAEIEAILAE